MTSVIVNTITHSVVYVTDNILKSLKDIIVLSGLDPRKLSGDWEVLHEGIRTWLESQHLESVTLEIFNPVTDALVGRWDLEIVYGWNGESGNFWVDTDQLRFAIKKAGIAPASAGYRIIVGNKSGKPAVAGWSNCQFRSTSGFVKQSLGGTLGHSGLEANASYWRKVG